MESRSEQPEMSKMHKTTREMKANVINLVSSSHKQASECTVLADEFIRKDIASIS